MKQEQEWDDLELEAPIIPDSKDENKYINSGWKFYVKTRKDLSTYWEDFNGATSKGRPKYRTVREFIKSTFKRKEDRDLFYTMVCPYNEYELLSSVDYGKSSKKVIPWLGDWYKRRKNGYWQENNSVYLKSLQKSIKENLESNQAIKASAPFLIQEMMRYARLQSKIEQAFGGEPFLDEAPTTPANRKRFEVFIMMLSSVTKVKVKLIHEWMRIHGVNPREPNQMWNMATLAQQFGQVGAAGALTGVASGIMLQNPNGPPTNLSRDTLLLAENIHQHSMDFAEVKEKVIEVINPLDKVDKVKTNGKHSTQ